MKSGIIVWYDGDPYGKDEEIEARLSPTDIIDLNDKDKDNKLKE